MPVENRLVTAKIGRLTDPPDLIDTTGQIGPRIPMLGQIAIRQQGSSITQTLITQMFYNPDIFSTPRPQLMNLTSAHITLILYNLASCIVDLSKSSRHSCSENPCDQHVVKPNNFS